MTVCTKRRQSSPSGMDGVGFIGIARSLNPVGSGNHGCDSPYNTAEVENLPVASPDGFAYWRGSLWIALSLTGQVYLQPACPAAVGDPLVILSSVGNHISQCLCCVGGRYSNIPWPNWPARTGVVLFRDQVCLSNFVSFVEGRCSLELFSGWNLLSKGPLAKW